MGAKPMIDITQFLNTRGEELFGINGLYLETPTDEFLQFFLEKHASLDAEHVRCALLILSSIDNEALRRIAKSYHDHPNIHAQHGSGVFFARQVEHGFIKPMTFQDWTASV